MGVTITRKAPDDLLPVPALLETLAALEVEWKVTDDRLSVRDTFGVLTAEIKAAVAQHKPVLIRLATLRAAYVRLYDYCARLRCADPPKGTRQDGLAYIGRQIEAFADRCTEGGITDYDGHLRGYDDPEDDMIAPVAVLILREELAELTAPGNPYPLRPLSADPMAMDPPRLPNGKLL